MAELDSNSPATKSRLATTSSRRLVTPTENVGFFEGCVAAILRNGIFVIQSRPATICAQGALRFIWIFPLMFFLGTLILGFVSVFSFFIVSVIIAANTLLALNRHCPLVPAIFFQELPLAFLVPALITGFYNLAIEKDEEEEVYAYIGFGCTCFTSLVMLVHLYFNVKSYFDSKKALEASGVDVSELGFEINPFIFLPNNSGLLCCHRVTTKNVVYAKVDCEGRKDVASHHRKGHCNETKTLSLYAKVYEVNDEVEDKPMLIYIHGGAWFWGAFDMHAHSPFLHAAADSGFRVMSIDYRLAPYNSIVDQVVDCKMAIKYAKETYGARTIICMGDSAGGHLSQVLGLTMNKHVKAFQPGFEDFDTSIDGVVDLYGPHDFQSKRDDDQKNIMNKRLPFSFAGKHFFGLHDEIDRETPEEIEIHDLVSPIHHLDEIDADAIPTWLCFHGTKDMLVPIEESRNFYQKLFKKKGSHAFSQAMARKSLGGVGCDGVARVEARGASHGFPIMPTLRVQLLANALVTWLHHVDKQKHGELSPTISLGV